MPDVIDLRYDPRDPPENALVHNGSMHPAHARLRKTLVLLRLGGAYFVIEGLHDWPCTLDELRNGTEYFYSEHTCPTNFARCFDAIVEDGDFDPHGVFEFVDVVWMTCEYEVYSKDKEPYLRKIFPLLNEG